MTGSEPVESPIWARHSKRLGNALSSVTGSERALRLESARIRASSTISGWQRSLTPGLLGFLGLHGYYFATSA